MNSSRWKCAALFSSTWAAEGGLDILVFAADLAVSVEVALGCIITAEMSCVTYAVSLSLG